MLSEDVMLLPSRPELRPVLDLFKGVGKTLKALLGLQLLFPQFVQGFHGAALLIVQFSFLLLVFLPGGIHALFCLVQLLLARQRASNPQSPAHNGSTSQQKRYQR